MRGLMGALMFAGLVAGCGGALEDTVDDAQAGSNGEVEAQAMCTSTKAHYARYYYENGVECGLRYYFCDGTEAARGCTTTTYTQYYYCECP